MLSLLIPGLGQLYKTRVVGGFVWFAVVLVGYTCLVIPGLVLHFLCIVDAVSGDPYKRAGGI